MADLSPTIALDTAGAWPGVAGFCTSRQGGVSQPPYDTFNLGLNAGDAEPAVLANRARLRLQVPGDPVWLRQVHGAVVYDADSWPDTTPQADASVTTVAGRVLAILTADCLPIVLSDVQARVLGVAHAGWRGLAGGVLEATLTAMRARAPGARSWRAWIGPGIGPRRFEVGQDVRDAFAHDGAPALALFAPVDGRPDKWMADLPSLAALRLHRAGVSRVLHSACCTASEPGTFFSYRRDGPTGRMATVAWLSRY